MASELIELFDGRLSLYQPKQGYRFSVDVVLLGSFAAERAAGTVADLGTGSGILPVILARHDAVHHITGIEIQPDLAGMAERNAAHNACEDKVRIVKADMRETRTMFAPESFDTVITNPPFYRAGSGRINPDNAKAAARHELYGSLTDFVAVAAFLLKQTGRFMAVYLAARVVDLVSELRLKNIEPKTLRFVHPRIGEPANLVLVEGVKAAGVEAKVLPPLIMYDAKDGYTEEVKMIFKRI